MRKRGKLLDPASEIWRLAVHVVLPTYSWVVENIFYNLTNFLILKADPNLSKPNLAFLLVKKFHHIFLALPNIKTFLSSLSSLICCKPTAHIIEAH